MTMVSATPALLLPIAADRPCGEDLENTPLLASLDACRVFGQFTPVDPPPDWNVVRATAAEALARSKDLRVLAHFAAATLRIDGLAAFADALATAPEWLTSYWREVYPLADDDPVFRRSALNCFADHVAVVDAIRRVPLASSRQLGRVSLRDLELASGQLQPLPSETRPDESTINAALAAAATEELVATRESAATALAALQRIEAVMRETAGPTAAPSFEPLVAQLARIERVLRSQLATRSAGGDTTDYVAAAESSAVAATDRSGGVGPIRSRADAVRALDAVAAWFRQQEPSSPVPLLIERAKRLVSKDFLEVLADIAPDALAQARAAGGVRNGD